MIHNNYLDTMTKVQLDIAFQNLMNNMVNMYNGKLLLFRIAGIPPEEAIDDLFAEMKQIWLRRLTLEMKGGE